MVKDKIHDGKRVYEWPFKGEKYREEDGLILDTADFCAIIIDEKTDHAQEVIRRSNLYGSPFLTERYVPLNAILREVPGVVNWYVAIGGLVVESCVLHKVLNVIGEWDVEFYKAPSNELLGIKARKEAFLPVKPLDQRTVNKGVIYPEAIPLIKTQSTSKLEIIEIPTIQEKLDYYIWEAKRIKPEFSLALWRQGKIATLTVQRYPASYYAWQRKAYFYDAKAAAQMNQSSDLTKR